MLNPKEFEPKPKIIWNKYFPGSRFSISSTGSCPFSKSGKWFALRKKRQDRKWMVSDVHGAKQTVIDLGSPGVGNSSVMEYFNWDMSYNADVFIDLTNDKLTHRLVENGGHVVVGERSLPNTNGRSWRTIPNNGSPIWLMNWAEQSHVMWRPDQPNMYDVSRASGGKFSHFHNVNPKGDWFAGAPFGPLQGQEWIFNGTKMERAYFDDGVNKMGHVCYSSKGSPFVGKTPLNGWEVYIGAFKTKTITQEEFREFCDVDHHVSPNHASRNNEKCVISCADYETGEYYLVAYNISTDEGFKLDERLPAPIQEEVTMIDSTGKEKKKIIFHQEDYVLPGLSIEGDHVAYTKGDGVAVRTIDWENRKFYE